MAQIDHHLLMALMNTTPDRIYFKDRDGRFLLVNQALRNFHKVTDDSQIIGRTDFDLFLLDHAKEAYADEQQVLSTGQPIVSKLEREDLADGRITWSSTTKVPLHDGSGQIIGTCGISRDVTEEHAQAERLQEFADSLAEKQSQMEEELAMAREVQLALLPQSYPIFPRTATEAASAIHFAHRYFPEGRVGGDFFTINQISDTQAGILVCDVMGHGVHAALVTAVQRVLVEEIQSFASDPGGFLGELNRRLNHFFLPLSTSMFVTALYAVVDIGAGVVRFANASHPMPLHIDRTNNTVRSLGDTSQRHPFALGVAKDSVYPTEEATIKPGDFLLLYTDGLTDLGEGKDLTADDPEFIAILQECSKQRGEACLDAILSRIREFSGRETFADDVCLVGVEIERLVEQAAW
jgi:sigma-B regulation protein RsbU (phosphoserine phosphatase)